MRITWFGHASFLIESEGKTIYIDPYVLPANAKLADIILITHDHFDHCDPAKVNEIRKPDTSIVTTAKAAAKLEGNVTVVKPGDSTEAKGVKISAIYAYNPAKPFHARGEGVGFVVEVEGKRIYHAGDTDVIPEMEELREITVALLPIGGTYTMNLDEAVEAVRKIKPAIAVPMHYNFLEGLEADALEFKRKVEETTETKVEILEGRSIEI